MPPTGGFGGNTGVQDVHNLAWKLALVLRGDAGEELLSTYDAERRPVGELTAEQAYTRYVLRLAPELGTEDLQPIVPEYSVELGYRYRFGAVLLDADDDGAPFENPYEPSGRPGTRTPHLVLDRAGDPLSSLDLVDRAFVLLAGPDGDAWCRAASEAAARLGVQIDVYRVGGDVSDSSGRFSEAYGTGDAGAVLVRPDGFIGWRAAAGADGGEDVLPRALSRLLCREGA
jgi:hypothetical protein